MPSINREDKDNLTSLLTVTIPYSEYSIPVNKELNKIRKGASFKGFRAGKAPMSFVKKMYGGRILLDELNKILTESTQGYFKDIKMLGQPLPIDQESMDFNVLKKNDYDFKFEIGLRPEIELEGYSVDTTLTLLKATVEDAEIDTEIKNNQERFTTSAHPTDDIVDKDLIKIHLQELKDGAIKTNGIEHTTTTAVDRIQNETLKAHILTLKTGDTFTTNVYELDDIEPEKIRKYLLDIEEEDLEFLEIEETFQATIEEVTRQAPGELNPMFYEKVFPGEAIQSEDAFRAAIRTRIETFYNAQAEVKLLYDLESHLKAANEIPLPEAFLKRWMAFTNKKTTEEKINAEFDQFVSNLKWTLLKETLAEEHDIKVEEAEILANVKNVISGYYGGMAAMGGDDSFLDNMAERLLGSEQGAEMREQAYQEILSRKLITAIKEVVTLEEQEITAEALAELLKKEQEERTGKPQVSTEEVAVTEEVAAIEEAVETEIEEATAEIEEAVAAVEEEIEVETNDNITGE